MPYGKSVSGCVPNMEENKFRSFVDAVYGHIYIRKDYCHEVIDSLLYQRLKRIEQTSMRPIFPSAHHDRFSHSLGTYHIGRVIFQHLSDNTKRDSLLYDRIDQCVPKLYKEKKFWDLVKDTYELACLLHDCGHAPFSHTFEDYYLEPAREEGKLRPLQQDLLDAYSQTIEYIDKENRSALGKAETRRLKKEFEVDLLNCGAKPHEMVSAWLCLHEKGFRRQIYRLGGDPLLVARMILGCKYIATQNFNTRVWNCFIGLLNGDEIDADRTDYAIRDKWATGLNTATINLERLFSSIHLFDAPDAARRNEGWDYPLVCFSKSALPELESILEIKNYNSFWIFKHHKVLYHERVLRKAVEKLALLFEGREAIEQYLAQKREKGADHELQADGVENNALYRFFDYHNLIEPVHKTIEIDGIAYREELYLLSDDDLVHLLKKFFCVQPLPNEGYLKEFYRRNNYAEEWLSRQHHLIPLWKSFVEFSNKFLKHHYELISLECLVGMLEKQQICERKSKGEVEKLLSDPRLSESLYHLRRIHGEGGFTIARLLEKCTQNGEVRYAEWFGRLKRALQSYHISRDGDIRKAIEEAINGLHGDGFQPDPATYKFINTDRVNLRPIEQNSIYIDMKDGSVVEYTCLGLPTKNQKREYEFFYAYLPALLDHGAHLEVRECREKYTLSVQEAIEKIKREDFENATV